MFCKNCGAPMEENQAFCENCGTKNVPDKSFCPGCGKEVDPQAAFCDDCGAPLKKGPVRENNTSAVAGIVPRSIVTAIILSIVTCGIYSLYWFICLTNDMNKASGRVNDTNGGMALVLSLVTCGIYTLFWAYKLGEKRDIVAKENGSSAILYLVLSLFGFGIIAYCLAQDAINKAVERR